MVGGGIATLGGAMARQRLGQHFLGDVSWRRRVFETLPRHAGDVWLEIGAGHGEMTEILAGDGRRVIAVETDARLVPRLQEKAREWPGVKVVAGDILSVDPDELIGDARVRVYGNLPYYITSPILHWLFKRAGRIASIHVVIQFEVAVRIVAKPGRREYGYLSAACQFYARPAIALRIPAGAFRPPPKVTSALVRMDLPGEREKLGITDDAGFLRFVQTCFGQKRKTLRNNLLATADAEKIRATLEAGGLRGDARAEQLSLGQFAALFRQLASGQQS